MPNIRFVEFQSECLKANPLGDPHTRKFPVYLPPNYDQETKRYPVIFGLTGFTGYGEMYLNKRGFAPSLDEILEDLIVSGKMPPAIYVMPNCFTKYGGSQYVNSSAVGNYEDYIVKELVPFIDKEFRTNGNHGCVGGSSGGIGSFTLAAKHPEVFSAFADHCGDSAFEYCYMKDVPQFVLAMQKYDYSLKKFIDLIPTIQPKDTEFLCILNLMAMAACYAPNPNAKPLGFELPFKIKTGETIPEVWEKFIEHDPVRMVQPYAENLRKLKLLFIDCGSKDQFNLFIGARQLSDKLGEQQIDHIYDEYNSDHFLLRFEQKRKSIPMVAKALVD